MRLKTTVEVLKADRKMEEEVIVKESILNLIKSEIGFGENQWGSV